MSRLQGAVQMIRNMLLRDGTPARYEAAEELYVAASEAIAEVERLSAELAAAKKTSDELLAALERLKASFEYGQFVGIAPDGCARAKAFIISAIASAKGDE